MPPSRAALTAATLGGTLNVAVVLFLYVRGAYPTLETTTGILAIVLPGFALGFVSICVTVYTRLVLPALGFLGVLGGAAVLEVTSPSPEWSEMNGYIIVEGSTHVSSYANTWYLWLALVVVAGVVEFGLRRGYAIHGGGLRNLPDLPLDGWGIIVAMTAILVGIATASLVVRSGLQPFPAVAVVGLFAAAVTAVPVAGLLRDGVVAPIALFAVFVPYMLVVEVFLTTDSPVHILLFGPYAIVLLIAWGLEKFLRYRVMGWNGGRFSPASTGQP